MTEKLIDKVARIVVDPTRIRNICTSAHIHHGKCISGNSRLILTNGSVKTAKDIFEEVSKNGEVYKDNENYTVYTPKEKVEVYSLDKTTGKIEKKPIQYAWRLIGGNTLKIKLRNRFEITTTPEHRYLTYKDGFKYVEAKDLKIRDRIVCARKLNASTTQDLKKAVIEKLSEYNFYAKLNNEFSKDFKARILEYKIKNPKPSIKQKSFYNGVWQNRYNLKDLINITKLFSMDLNGLYDKIEGIYYRTGKQRGHNSLLIKLPQDFNDFYYLAGLFLGDGSAQKFIVGKPQLAELLESICSTLKISTKTRKFKDKTPEIHTNKSLLYMLHALFDYPLKKKSHNIKISDLVWGSNDKYIASLLKGYFDTEGSVEKSRSAITINSASSRMIEDLHLLLLRFGIVSIKEIDNTLLISGISAINFEKLIGFNLTEKKERLRLLVNKVSGSIVCDTIQVGNQVMLVNKKVKEFSADELSYIEVSSIEASHEDIVYDFTIADTHNFIAEGIVVHNTALTDNLLAAAGQMAAKYAGDLEQGMATWQHADEQERLMTVDAANVSMVHEFNGKEFLINLIDTPGHVDFGGNVTRAMRAVDGTVVLICAVEGIMPQTETVVRQAVRERVKPILFINKVDRLVKELKLSPEKISERILTLVKNFNDLIERIAEPEYKEKWKVSVQEGAVAFGSARENWALSFPYMQKKSIKFSDILRIYEMDEEERKKWVWENAPVHEVLLDMIIKHHPNPIEAQTYRIPKIWHGDIESEFGKDLIKCNPNGKLAFVITRIVIDPRSGKDISAGRLFSGTIRSGTEVYLNNAKQRQRIQNVYIYNGIKPEIVESLPAGNVLAISGVIGNAGETVTLEEEQPFEELKHIFEPVITKAIEPKKPIDLPKLIEVLRKVSREDPSIKIEINEETGENLMHGMGELHLEVIENRIITEKGVEVKTSEPIVVYRESITRKSGEVEGKSPNKHNKFYFIIEPMPEEIYKAIQSGDIPEGRIKKKNETQIAQILMNFGIDSKEARSYKEFYKSCALVDNTRGIVHINEVIELIMDGFEQVIDAGPLAREPCMKMIVRLTDCNLHEDAIHRGPAQVYPAIREGLREAMNQSGPVIYEPVQKLRFEAPESFMGAISKLISNKRGQIVDMEQEGDHLAVIAKLPVGEMFGLNNELRSATEGRGTFFVVDQTFEKMPFELQEKIIRQIRTRKGLSDNA
jgi:elongation factor 2